MTKPGEVLDGRTYDCPSCGNRRVCSACGSRIRYGKPRPEGIWDTLRMGEMDWRRLLMAAAEFDAIAQEHTDRPTAREFVDWIFLEVVKDAA